MCECKPSIGIGVADENRETGEWRVVEGKTYYSIDATLSGSAYHQEAVCSLVMLEM